jgi:hypothetical protein
LITAMATHYFVPAMMRNGAIAGPRRRDLKHVLKLNGIHLVAAAAVPMLGVLLVTIALFFAVSRDEEHRWPLIVVSAGGLAWLAIVMSLKRMIELDVAALDQVAIDEPRHGSGGRSSRGSAGSSRRSAAPR